MVVVVVVGLVLEAEEERALEIVVLLLLVLVLLEDVEVELDEGGLGRENLLRDALVGLASLPRLALSLVFAAAIGLLKSAAVKICLLDVLACLTSLSSIASKQFFLASSMGWSRSREPSAVALAFALGGVVLRNSLATGWRLARTTDSVELGLSERSDILGVYKTSLGGGEELLPGCSGDLGSPSERPA